MKKRCVMIVLFTCIAPLLLAETNALIEVKLFKTWVIKGEWNFGNLVIQNTGTEPFLLASAPEDFEMGQLDTRSLDNNRGGETPSMREELYRLITDEGGKFVPLSVGEKCVYAGRKFHLPQRSSFSETMRFKVSVYLGNGFWLDSEALTVSGVIPDSEEYVATITNNKFIKQKKIGVDHWKLVLITYKEERWLYKTSITGGGYYPVCPVSLGNKIRVEPHNDAELFRIWDGDKSMIYNMYSNMIVEGPDENDVLGKWTRDKKKEVQAHNDEVRRKKGGQ